MIKIQSFVLNVEAEATLKDMEVLARSLAFYFLNKSGKLKYSVIFSYKGKRIHQFKAANSFICVNSQYQQKLC